MKAFVLSLVVLAAGSGAAAAADFTATLQAPVKAALTVVRQHTVWRCEKDQCKASLVSEESDTWQSCQQLARRVGVVVAYGTLDATALAKCNGQQASK